MAGVFLLPSRHLKRIFYSTQLSSTIQEFHNPQTKKHAKIQVVKNKITVTILDHKLPNKKRSSLSLPQERITEQLK